MDLIWLVFDSSSMDDGLQSFSGLSKRCDGIDQVLALSSYLYNKKIITAIGELVGKVVKLDLNTDSRTMGHFTRLAVYVNLEEPLVSQILINGRSQKVEYEALSTICFQCGRYGHVENLYNLKSSKTTVAVNCNLSASASGNQKLDMDESEKEDGNYGSWMIVERKSRCKFRDNSQKSTRIQEKGRKRSRFSSLNNRDFLKNGSHNGEVLDCRSSEGKEIASRNQHIKDVDLHFNRLNDSFKKPNKGKQKDVGPIIEADPFTKGNTGLILDPRLENKGDNLNALKLEVVTLGLGSGLA
ncbi:hypothetical protein J1N35_044502 [Gossypium stocksii]|uniref:Zinc knuckle CX2CX4HX4C domain-containing protein n=1 Tax=Gossypium stocksii TaxID=47602 RepID=A0A9D3U9M1_9ROSI|nr:hypothetical protein J1N35_044502 [Gossypium stocksii]